MQTLTIVKTFDPFKDAASSLVPGHKVTEKYVFLLQCAEETFDNTVIPTIPLAAHTADDPVCAKQGLVIMARVLRSTIRVGQ
jgi:hypothetical protein